jgi:hypothetical protein
MSDFYDKYRGGLELIGLAPDWIDVACDELLCAGEPREAVQLLQAFELLPEPVRSKSRSSLIWLLTFVPKPTPASDSSVDSEPPDDGKCIILNHPEYSPALEALAGPEGDARPIARLLKRRVPMPDWIGLELGKMLAPSSEYRGNSLEVKVSKIRWQGPLATSVRHRDIGNRLRALTAERWNWEAAVVQVAQEFRVSESLVKKCLHIDDRELVRRSQGLLGNIDEDITY